jgi:hypothetical protein
VISSIDFPRHSKRIVFFVSSHEKQAVTYDELEKDVDGIIVLYEAFMNQ